jgi:glucose/arabinose dehydrogenase
MKKMYLPGFLFFLFFTIRGNAQIIDTIGNTPIRIDSLVGFPTFYSEQPWDLHWAPDNTLWYTMGNRLCRYDTTTHTVDTIFKRYNASGSYALGVATHPNFALNPVVYIAFDTTGTYYGGGTKIVLYKYDYSISGDSLYNETEMLSWHHGGEHSGGRLHVGQDNYLYVTTAEYYPPNDTGGNLSGKILRVNLNGTVPAINVSGTYAISYGHRNPQGIVQVPNGNVIISEFGEGIDELNLIVEYKDYGWPTFDYNQCTNIIPDSCTSLTYNPQDPIDTAIRPPSGIDYYDHPAIPELQGCILQSILSFGGYQGGMVASKLNATMDDVVSDIHYFKGEYLRWRDVCVSPDGKIFAITNDRQIPRIRMIYSTNYHASVEENPNPDIGIYPNPVENFLTIQSKKNVAEWKIISIDGKEWMNGKNAALLFQIDVTGLPTGIYFFKTENGSRKFVKE